MSEEIVKSPNAVGCINEENVFVEDKKTEI